MERKLYNYKSNISEITRNEEKGVKLMYKGKEISLTQLADYVWCRNKPVFALMGANKEKNIDNETVEEEYEESYPSVIIAKRSKPISGGGYSNKVFYIEDSLYGNLFGSYKDSITLYEDVFSEVMDSLKLGMNYGNWKDLTYFMGSVAEENYGKGTYKKIKLMGSYGEFIVVNVPDAILNGNTVYEFKTVQYTDFIDKQKDIAELQCDLTAYLFGYDYIDVDVFDFNDLKPYPLEREADLGYAEEVLDEIFYNYENEIIDRSLRNGKRCKDCLYINQCH